MGEHLVVNVDQLPKRGVVESNSLVPPAVGYRPTEKNPEMMGPSSSTVAAEDSEVVVFVEDDEEADELAPLIGIGECRICQEEDHLNNLESPCACRGSLKYAHRKCVQHWCNEKGDIICEICHQPYQPGYTVPPRPPHEETTIDIGGVWQISGTPFEMHDPRILTLTDAERQLFQTEYADYNGTHSSGVPFYRSAATILLSLLVLRHGISITDDGSDGNGDDDALTSITLFMTQIIGFLLPFYVVLWIISILQHRRQTQEAAALAATRFAIVVQSSQNRGGLFVASAAPTINSQATPAQVARHQEDV
ncbi:uncharacterized protein LOC142556758 [Primulina tabacum]|uniref:uncharacterized protein LOC142556758 n=1 Tax=Primulina tabacum TaxID=48773 RepID=UPI003F5978C1